MYHLDGRSTLLIRRDGQRLSLEGNYWCGLMRLLPVFNLSPDAYVPSIGQHNYVSAVASKKLVQCLEQALDDIPPMDLWPNGEVPDPMIFPPFKFLISGYGVSYLMDVIDFVVGNEFWLEVSEPETEL